MHCKIENILSSSKELKIFFEANQDVVEIEKISKTPFSHTKTQLLNNRWNVAVIFTRASFKRIALVFVSCIGDVSSQCGSKSISKRCTVLASNLYADYVFYKNLLRYHQRLLAPAMNCHQLSTSDFYLHSPVPKNKNIDPQILDSTFSLKNEISFDHLEGVCRGMGIWFWYLYMQTRTLFDDPAAHMQALGMQFRNGASRQAALIQSFYKLEKKFLNYRPITDFAHFSASKFIKNPEEAKEFLEDLYPGAYTIWVYHHVINCLILDEKRVLDEKRAFIFDPNAGVIDISGENPMQLLYEHLKSHQQNFNFDEKEKVFKNIIFNLVNKI